MESSSIIRQKAESRNGFYKKKSTPNFPKNELFLPLDTNTCVCVNPLTQQVNPFLNTSQSFLVFSGDRKWEHWPEMGQDKQSPRKLPSDCQKLSQLYPCFFKVSWYALSKVFEICLYRIFIILRTLWNFGKCLFCSDSMKTRFKRGFKSSKWCGWYYNNFNSKIVKYWEYFSS